MKTREQKIKAAINYAVKHGANERELINTLGDVKKTNNLIELAERCNDGKFSAKHFLSFVYA